jgi:hypothetical protein
VTHLFASAVSDRSKCRGCGRIIRRGELRFGERLPNLFGEGEMTLWFHPRCAAYKRPQPLLQGLAQAQESIEDREGLERDALEGIAHGRLPRIDGAERAPTGQARCRSCRQPIERQSWRIRLSFYEEGRFSAGGFVHLGCRNAYFEIDQMLARLLQFSPGLNDEEREELAVALK